MRPEQPESAEKRFTSMEPPKAIRSRRVAKNRKKNRAQTAFFLEKTIAFYPVRCYIDMMDFFQP
jgi:hypothetical protein